MKQNALSIRMWVYFCMNYPDMHEVIDYMCKKCNEQGQHYYDPKHLWNKFSYYYDEYGSRAAMNTFYCELSRALQDALADYVINVWAEHGMCLNEEQKDLLGINK